MTAGIPAGVDPEVLLAIGVACLTGAVTVWFAVASATLTDAEAVGVVTGTAIAAAVYLLVTRFGVPLLLFSTPAIAVSAVVIVVAAFTALVRVSRASL